MRGNADNAVMVALAASSFGVRALHSSKSLPSLSILQGKSQAHTGHIRCLHHNTRALLSHMFPEQQNTTAHGRSMFLLSSGETITKIRNEASIYAEKPIKNQQAYGLIRLRLHSFISRFLFFIKPFSFQCEQFIHCSHPFVVTDNQSPDNGQSVCGCCSKSSVTQHDEFLSD